jgi:hypothetical protein
MEIHARKKVIFGKVFIVQDEEIVDPTIFEIKGLVKRNSW